MNRMLIVAMLGALLPMPAAASLALAQKHSCMACHALDKPLVGPPFRTVARTYAGKQGAEARLIQKVRNGGSGAWGKLPMPPNPQVGDADLRALVKWILALPPQPAQP